MGESVDGAALADTYSSVSNYRNCAAYSSQPLNAAWIAAAEKASQWATKICELYDSRTCITYGAYLNDCAGGDIVIRWYNGGVPLDVDVPRWLCTEGYASPLHQMFYPISGVMENTRTPDNGPLYAECVGCSFFVPDAPRPELYALLVQWNDHVPLKWFVDAPKGCEPGKMCRFDFWFPCEPLEAGKEPKIVKWLYRTKPGRIRPSSGSAE